MKRKYRHTQYGVLNFVVFLIVGVLIAVVALRILAEDRVPSALLMVLIYLFGVVMFASLTVEISEEALKFWFGIGIIQKTIKLSEIQSSQEIKNPWYYFWGIKSIPTGWFYAIAPGDAVELELIDGKVIQLGTDQPEELNQAIESAKRRVGIT